MLPPSAEVLVGRLAGRQTEAPAVIRERITRAADELAAVAEYDYAIFNEDLVLAVAQVAAILDAEARRVARQEGLTAFIERLRRDVLVAASRISARLTSHPKESRMRITTPAEVAKQAGNKYLGVLVAAKFARYLNEFPKDQLAASGEKLTTQALQSLVEGDLNYKLVRRRRSEA